MSREELQSAKKQIRATTRARYDAETEWREAILEALESGASQKTAGYWAGVSQQRVAQIVREERQRT